MIKPNYKLVAIKDQATGEVGLILDGMQHLNTGDMVVTTNEGRLIAHVLCEHVNGLGKIGTYSDELEALGAMWYVRGQWNMITKHDTSGRTSYEVLTRDILGLLEEAREAGKEEVLHNAACSIQSERTEEDLEPFMDYLAKDANLTDMELVSVMVHLQIGHDKAINYYENVLGLNSKMVPGLFWSIADAIDEALKETGQLYEGMEYDLNIDLDACEATCNLIEEEYLDEDEEDEG